jgi:hypothetical protein
LFRVARAPDGRAFVSMRRIPDGVVVHGPDFECEAIWRR